MHVERVCLVGSFLYPSQFLYTCVQKLSPDLPFIDLHAALCHDSHCTVS